MALELQRDLIPIPAVEPPAVEPLADQPLADRSGAGRSGADRAVVITSNVRRRDTGNAAEPVAGVRARK